RCANTDCSLSDDCATGEFENRIVIFTELLMLMLIASVWNSCARPRCSDIMYLRSAHAASAPSRAITPTSPGLQTLRTTPVLRDDRMSCGCGVDAIRGPVLRGRRARPLIEDRLQRHERRASVRRDAGRGGATLVEFGEPARVHRPRPQHERLEQDQLHARQSAARLGQQGRVLLLVVLHGAVVTVVQLVPKVVDADQ